MQESEECPAPARPTKAKAKAKQSPAKRPAANGYETPKKRPATRETEDEYSDATTLELGAEIPKKKKTEKKGEQKAKSKAEKKVQDKKELKSESKAKGEKQESTSKSKSEKQESKSESKIKRPAAAAAAADDTAARRISNVYFYKKSNIWGVKVDGKEAFAVRYSFPDQLEYLALVNYMPFKTQVGGMAIPAEKSREIAAVISEPSSWNDILVSCWLSEDIGRNHLAEGASLRFVRDTVATVPDLGNDLVW